MKTDSLRTQRHPGWRLLLLAVVVALAAPARSQQPLSITVDVKVVNVLATVRDKKGGIVQDLTRDDFLLQEDGHPQAIRYFARQTDLPLTLGLLVDTSMSVRNVLGQERRASGTFLDQILREDKDKAFVIHFDREVELLQDLTASRQKLQAALDALETTPTFSERGRDQQGGGDRAIGAGAATSVAAGEPRSTTRSTWRRTKC